MREVLEWIAMLQGAKDGKDVLWLSWAELRL